MTRRLIEHFVRSPISDIARNETFSDVTPRELEVLELIARGLSNLEIAQTLHLSQGTVKTHVAHILHKLGLRDRVQAVAFAYETGLVQPGSVPAHAPKHSETQG